MFGRETETRPMLMLVGAPATRRIPRMPHDPAAQLGHRHGNHPPRTSTPPLSARRFTLAEAASLATDAPVPCGHTASVRAPRPAQAAIAAPS
jgi:hypothetical protein